MRLLNTAKLELQQFKDDSIPQYTILSHTWDEVELTFQDMKGAAAAEKKGYQKVEKCCSMARDRGHDHVWIDTCCIDKTSSAELSEAINSMYRWYQEATVCYAYLADVPHDPQHQLSGLTGPEFSQSKWFCRGWTLQELIAPPDVIFLDKEWKEIGSKSTLRESVSRITGIPVDILTRNYDLERVSVAQRMSWAAERKTTKIEDRAYSLMGIFDINMPLIYGEGEKAFIRLQEEIMKVLDDHSIFAWTSEKENHRGLLATSPDAFKGSANIIPFNPFIASSSPLTISNKGIHLALRFMGIGRHGLGLAILHSERGQYDEVKMLLARGDILADARDKYGRTPLSYAAGQGHVEVVWLLLQTGKVEAGSSDREGRTPLVYAVVGGYEEVVWLLLTRSDVQAEHRDRYGWTPLSHAAREGQEALIKLFLARSDTRGQLEDDSGRTILSHAAEKGNEAIVKLLLARTDIGPDAKDDSGRTPLWYAAKGGHESVMRLLLDKGADIESKDDWARTPLILAAQQGYDIIVQLLLDKGADMESKDNGGRTPLLWAAEKGHDILVRLLLDKGADIESKHESLGWTPLIIAAREGHEAIIRLLIDKGADIKSKDYKGRTPLWWWAVQNGRDAVVQLFKEKEAV
ncbi:hypothetical protein DL765_008428 [Monosporascus sp. GIB2]|nr:hypothetical protein DL765_008428 [Monosporascus sp. GIB2]